MVELPDLSFRELMNKSLTPMLKSLGFTRRGNSYSRKVGEVTHFVDFQRSQWNTSADLSFTVNLSIYVPGFIASYGRIPDPPIPREVDGCIRTRLGPLTDYERDKWWHIKVGDTAEDLRAVEADIETSLIQSAMPFLARFDSLTSVILYLEGPRPEREKCTTVPNREASAEILAILYHLQGDSLKCHEKLTEAIDQTRNKVYKSRMAELLERLCP